MVVEDAHLLEKLEQRHGKAPIKRGMQSSLQTTMQGLKLSKTETDERIQINVSNPLKNTLFV